MAKKSGGPAHSHLPDKKNAPKKTGPKSGVGGVRPLEAAKDFDTPAKKAPENDQPELLEVPKEKKPVVVKERFEATILPPVYSSAPKSGDKMISFKISLSLSEEHDKLFPKVVQDAWAWVKRPNHPKVSIGIPPQIVHFYLVSDATEEELTLPIAKVTNANLAVILKKGEGRALRVIRFQFRLQVPWSAQVSKFADSHYDMNLWLKMQTTQEQLFDTEEE